MAYSTNMDMLLAVLRRKCPEESEWLRQERNVVRHGLLSVGLKLHIISTPLGFIELIDALGGLEILTPNMYRKSAADFCLVLPPVGSADAAVRLLECIGKYTETDIFINPDVHIQVCSPGRLDQRRAAYLAIAFYLCSDTLRRYDLQQFLTTVSFNRYDRGQRMIIYDAANAGIFDREFAWWGCSPDGESVVTPLLPFKQASRTDILVGPGSALDIENINLVATLLVHAQYAGYDGYWHKLGQEFEGTFGTLLSDHCLMGLIDAPWVNAHDRVDMKGDFEFFSALKELMNYAYEEAHRLGLCNMSAQEGILNGADDIITMFRAVLTARTETPINGDLS